MDETQIRKLIGVWYRRAARDEDPFSKFVFLWFSLNAWITFASNKDTDRGAVEWLKGHRSATSPVRSSYNVALESEVFHGYLESLVRLSPIDHSRYGKPAIHIAGTEDFPNIVESIYQVRCNLFHGRKQANDPRDVKLVTVCARILQKWIGNLLASSSAT